MPSYGELPSALNRVLRAALEVSSTVIVYRYGQVVAFLHYYCYHYHYYYYWYHHYRYHHHHHHHYYHYRSRSRSASGARSASWTRLRAAPRSARRRSGISRIRLSLSTQCFEILRCFSDFSIFVSSNRGPLTVSFNQYPWSTLGGEHRRGAGARRARPRLALLRAGRVALGAHNVTILQTIDAIRV